VGSPTSAWTLADAIWRAARRADCVGTVHFTDGAELSRHDFVAAILEAAAARGLPQGRVVLEPVSTAQYTAENPATTTRPAYSVLDSSGLRRQLELKEPDWKEALDAVMDRYVASNG
jgi:dTDP-4-dehydrorhamnose reductase